RQNPINAGVRGYPLDVVHARAGFAPLALDDGGDARRGEDLTGGARGVGEDAIGVAAEGPVEQLYDLEHGDVGGVAGEAVAALHAALRADDARAAQRGEKLLEKLHRHVAGARELADRHGLGSRAL